MAAPSGDFTGSGAGGAPGANERGWDEGRRGVGAGSGSLGRERGTVELLTRGGCDGTPRENGLGRHSFSSRLVCCGFEVSAGTAQGFPT